MAPRESRVMTFMLPWSPPPLPFPLVPFSFLGSFFSPAESPAREERPGWSRVCSLGALHHRVGVIGQPTPAWKAIEVGHLPLDWVLLPPLDVLVWTAEGDLFLHTGVLSRRVKCDRSCQRPPTSEEPTRPPTFVTSTSNHLWKLAQDLVALLLRRCYFGWPTRVWIESKWIKEVEIFEQKKFPGIQPLRSGFVSPARLLLLSSSSLLLSLSLSHSLRFISPFHYYSLRF